MCSEFGEQEASVQDEEAHGHWWLLYQLLRDEWVNVGEFVSAGHLILWTAPLFTEVIDVAIPVDPLQGVCTSSIFLDMR
jgi:hypothetical protein